MTNIFRSLTPVVMYCTLAIQTQVPASQPDFVGLSQQFERYSGARLVFRCEQLPSGRYYDVMTPLRDSRKAEAAQICLTEVRKYPPGYLGDQLLRTAQISCCIVTQTDLPSTSFD